MARATSVDSTWVGELASDVSIGGTSATLADVTGTNWPSGAGIFGIQIGEDPDDDAELLQVTRSSTTLTLDASTPTLTKDHTAGASIYYLTTAPDINAKLDSSALDTDGTLAANSDAKVATQKATKTYADTKLAKTGGALSGDLTVPNIYGDAGQGYLGIYSPSGAGPWLYMDDLFAGLFDASFSQGFYVDESAGINGVAGNGLASGAWLAAPKFLSVPVTLTKTLLLTTADCGTVLISSAPATGGKVKLPSLSSGDDAAFLLVNYSAYDVTVERQGTNGITLLATGSTTSFTLPSKTAMHLTYYGGAGVYYQIAPEA